MLRIPVGPMPMITNQFKIALITGNFSIGLQDYRKVRVRLYDRKTDIFSPTLVTASDAQGELKSSHYKIGGKPSKMYARVHENVINFTTTDLDFEWEFFNHVKDISYAAIIDEETDILITYFHCNERGKTNNFVLKLADPFLSFG
jgi:hypothetical protein